MGGGACGREDRRDNPVGYHPQFDTGGEVIPSAITPQFDIADGTYSHKLSVQRKNLPFASSKSGKLDDREGDLGDTELEITTKDMRVMSIYQSINEWKSSESSSSSDFVLDGSADR
ncbi:hypothetical protein CDL15_Pgr004205 [Punica granatum]|uniref:Uncharacterized protein n=1 Tax=Punica granatum TaxID=22663 RepID=A0A218XFS3_PUNGR|nr:hypothetical protein CDL15_Pgr004205 [Punica granatum]